MREPTSFVFWRFLLLMICGPVILSGPVAVLASPLESRAAAALQEEPAEEPGEEPAEEPADPTELLNDGREALRLGEYEEAADAFQDLLKSGKRREEASVGIARAHRAGGRFDEALAALEAAPGAKMAPRILAEMGEIHLRRGKLAEAREVLELAYKFDRRSPQISYLLGDVYRRSGLLEKARGLFERSIDVYKDMSSEEAEAMRAEAFVYWGLALVGLNRFKDANDIMFSQAAEKDAKDPSLLLEWGRVFLSKYDFPESRKLYREAIDQNPQYADALVALAENYLTDFQVGTKRFGLAEKYLDRALEVHPGHSGAQTERGYIWYYDGHYDRAVAEFEKALEENPANMKALGLLAATYFVSGQDEAFAGVEKRALELNPKAAPFYHVIAENIENKFRYPDTVRFCDRALALDPDYWPAYTTLGINCLRTGEEARGREYLNRSWAKDRFNVWVFNTRAFLRHIDKNHVSIKNDRFEFVIPREDAPLLRPYLVPLMMEAFDTLAKRYKVEIETPIRIECFSKHKWFSARTVGLEGFAASGACFGKLVTLTTPKALPQNWGAVAWHEFAHVVTIQLTNYRIPRWLTEGISVYEEGHDRPHWTRNFQRDIADALASGFILPMAELDLGFSKPKFPKQILLSYYQGSLVVDYIEGKWGFDAVLKILDGYGNFKGTAEIFKEVLGLSPGEFDEEFRRYVAAWVKKNGYTPRPAESALEGLELKRDANPEDLALALELAWAYLANGEKGDATLLLNEILERDPESGDVHALLGMLHMTEKKNRLARSEFKKALELGTRFTYRSHAYLGDLLAKDDTKVTEALEHYEEAKKQSPIAGAGHPAGGGNLYYKMAKLYEAGGDAERANQLMEEVAAISSEDAECRMRIVQYAFQRKDAERAYRYLEQLLYINPFDPKLHRWLAQAAEKLQKHEVVIREWKILLGDRRTNTFQAHLALGGAYLGIGDFDRAKEEVRIVLNIDPSSRKAKEILEKAERGASAEPANPENSEDSDNP